jgi:excinuclease ABC subunit C
LLKEALRLKKAPVIMEAVDISNIGANSSAGSVVVFYNGLPLKNQYRRYRIKTKSKDDLAKISEVIQRRAKRIMSQQIEKPDLVVIDGGINQVNAAYNKFKEYKLNIQVIGISKKKEELWFPNNKEALRLIKDSEALKLVQRIRDEAHRFARKYHLFLRNKTLYD